MAIVLPDNKEDRKKAILSIVRGNTTEYTVGGTTYVVVPRSVSTTPGVSLPKKKEQ